MSIKNIAFEHRNGIEWVGWQQPNGDTTTDYVSQVQAGPDWELFRPAYEAWQADLIKPEDDKDMSNSTVTFDVRGGEDYATFTTQTGDTTATKVSSLKGDPAKGREPRPEWAIAGPQYEAWKADKKAQAEAKAADEAKAKDASQAPAEPAPAPEDNDDDDDDKNASAGQTGRRTLAKGYKK